MVFGLYLEINAHRGKQDARVPSAYSTPRAEQIAYNSTIPPLPPTQSVSSSIDGYVKWMSCHGKEMPLENVWSPTAPLNDEWSQAQQSLPPTSSLQRSRKVIPNGILRAPRAKRSYSGVRRVRWRDHESNNATSRCLSRVCWGGSALLDVNEGSFSGNASARRKPPLMKARDDPILSFRERDTLKHQELDRYGSTYSLKRTPSPHPVAANRLNTANSTLPLRRSPSPHPLKINQESQPVAINRGNSSSHSQYYSPRTRSTSPTPFQYRQRSPSPRGAGVVQQSTRDPSRPRTRDNSPVPIAANVVRRGTPQRQATLPTGQQLQHRTPSVQRRPTQQNQFKQKRDPSPVNQRATPQLEPKRYAELPGREEQRYAELSRREEISNHGKFAEIVWKSKDMELEDPPEVKKRGWNIIPIRRSGSLRKNQPQPESPQLHRAEQDNTETWIFKANSSISEPFDRYNTTHID